MSQNRIIGRVAGRLPYMKITPRIITKQGIIHQRRLPNGQSQEIMAVGGACSEIFTAERLAEILRPGFEYEGEVLNLLEKNSPAPPLSIHTSGFLIHCI